MSEDDLAAALASLKPLRGRLFVADPPAGARVIPAEDYLDPRTLSRVIECLAHRLGGVDRRVAASQWSKKYSSALLTGTLAAMTLRGIGLNASPSRVQIVIDKGLPKGVLIADLAGAVVYPPRLGAAWSLEPDRLLVSRADLYRAVLPPLFEQHLALMIDRVHAMTRLSKNILWGNAGSFCASFYDKLAKQGDSLAAVAADREILLEAPESPAVPGRNPLRHAVRYDDLSAFGAPITRVRRTCCLSNRLPVAKTCSSCPLVSAEQRVTLL